MLICLRRCSLGLGRRSSHAVSATLDQIPSAFQDFKLSHSLCCTLTTALHTVRCSMSNGQDDDAKKALDVARRKLAAGDLDGALRFTKKSISLHDTVTAQSLLKELHALQKEGFKEKAKSPRSPGFASSSSAQEKGATSPRSASSPDSGLPDSNKRTYTPEQAALVKRIRSCKITEYYEILSIEKGCEDVVIKKAYRKLALSLHPDKVSLAVLQSKEEIHKG